MTEAAIETGTRSIGAAIKPYIEPAPLAAFFLGVSSGFPFAMIAATLTTRLAQDGIDKKTVTAFALAFLVYNFKWLWAWVVEVVDAARWVAPWLWPLAAAVVTTEVP